MKREPLFVLRIDGKLPSWNEFYSAKHWRARSEAAALWHALVAQAVRQQDATLGTVRVRVDVEVVAYRSGHQIDADNVTAKLVVDGLVRADVLVNDTPRYVRRVTTESRRGACDAVEVTVYAAPAAERALAHAEAAR